jgi:hypothetical protein
MLRGAEKHKFTPDVAVEWVTVLLYIRRSSVQVSARMPAILTEGSRGFPQYIHGNVCINLEIGHDCVYTGAGIAQSLERKVTGWTAVVRFQAWAKVFFSIPQCLDQLWGPPKLHSYPMGTGGSFLGGKEAGA